MQVANKIAVSVLLLFTMVGSWNPPMATAAEVCDPWVAKIVSVEGTIEARKAKAVSWIPAKTGDTFCELDRVRVKKWRAAIVLSNHTIIRLDEGAELVFPKEQKEKSFWVELKEGILHFISRVPQKLTIKTSFLNAAVEGTEFVIQVEPNKKTRVWVIEGRVRVDNPLGQMVLTQDQAAEAQAGQPPRRILVKPRDAVQWALYYPPLIDTRAASLTGPNKETLQGPLALYNQGDLLGALKQMDAVPTTRRDAQFFTFRAGLLLSVGRIDQARKDLQQAEAIDPNNGLALALKSVIAVVQNNKDVALSLARQATEQEPNSPIPYIALSYAQQAHFDIDAALKSVQEATRLNPEDALALAREAELWLSKGYLDKALEVAQQAKDKNSALARTQTAWGFTNLMLAKINQARTAFEKAIKLDQADPLPRLGLGLAKIQKSQLAEGRREIEIAASLDPNNAIVRSYLGKAYFEERRDPGPKDPLDWSQELPESLSGTQFDLAKNLDPKDPTPYFYDAIRKQSQNRPVEALHDLQKSIELNDNRAVYRSKLLMDKDYGARSASLGRVYQDLGFQQRARVEGWYSLNTDPTNYSAHRLLADSYIREPRRDVARVSELLQTQLFQPVNINNLQPQLSELSLQILEGTGPSAGGFNEFNPIFFRDRAAFLGNFSLGSRDTFSNDAVLTGMLADPVSISLGQFFYDSSGFRPNSDVKHEIYNVFLQGEVNPKINLFGEFRYRDTTRGDLQQFFNPTPAFPNLRESIVQSTGRLGGRFAATPHSTFIATVVYSKFDAETNFGTTNPFIGVQENDNAYQGEAQYIYRRKGFNAILGGGSLLVDKRLKTDVGAITIPGPIVLVPASVTKTRPDFNYDNVYLYSTTTFPENVIWTGGLNFTHIDDPGKSLDTGKILPKLGLQVNVTPGTRVRIAYLQVIKGTAVLEQTIEPTQVTGFNQQFPDGNAVQSTLYGAAIDKIFSNFLYGGIEITHREFTNSATSASTGALVNFDYRNRIYHAYLYWAPHPFWAATVDFDFEKLYRPAEVAIGATGDGRWTQLNSIVVPIAVRFFHPSGFFAGLKGTILEQNLDVPSTATFQTDHEGVFLVDLVMGYRFPKRRGIFSIEIRNLTDQNFLYQDPNILRLTVGDQRFLPDLTAVARLTIALN